ncbi:PLP-dependent aminotransferase family protein [Mesorhizobium sp.]|uniref:aminotransferase-like domain-containing protein n=1 Tax=Mesorhizobium sp. TaxID=1871066 RepID=UPI00167931B7|nr:PLP-dependent aminotransferase family protein [Mesorhizobium sp.]
MVSTWIPNLGGGSQHRYRALAEAIRDAIQAGDLKAGDKLPPHREMAWKLGVTAATVSRAYNIAADWGLVFSRVGHGTRVREPGDVREPITLRERNERTTGTIGTPIDFGLLLPTPLQEHSLRRQAFENVFARIGRDILDRSLSGYAPDLGYLSHREEGAKWLKFLGVETDARDVIVTRGAQEAILLLLSMFTQPGDPVLVENPTYLGLSHLMRLRNHQMIPLQLDAEGVSPEAIELKAAKSGAKLLFLCPNLHNPTGVALTTERRHAIAQVAERSDLLIIENDPFSALIEKDTRSPAIASIAPERTIYLASLSKCTGPAMRVCFMRCPPAHTQGIEGVKHALTLGGAFLQSEIAAEWIRKGLLDRLCAWQRDEIMRRWSLARSIMGDRLHENLRPAPFVFIHLPEPWRAGEFVSAARHSSVICIEADRFTVGRAGAPQAVRLALSTPATEGEVRRGLEIVAGLMSTYSPSGAARY